MGRLKLESALRADPALALGAGDEGRARRTLRARAAIVAGLVAAVRALDGGHGVTGEFRVISSEESRQRRSYILRALGVAHTRLCLGASSLRAHADLR